MTRRQQRLLRAGTNVSRTKARMTLTGPRWTDLLLQLSGSASLADEAAIDGDDADRSPPESAAYRALVDAISVELGGPPAPRLRVLLARRERRAVRLQEDAGADVRLKSYAKSIIKSDARPPALLLASWTSPVHDSPGAPRALVTPARRRRRE